MAQKHPQEADSTTRHIQVELTEDELDQVAAGGTTPTPKLL